MFRAATILGAALLLAMSVQAAPVIDCVGDCNNDNMVLVNELIIGVNIALENTSIDECPEFDLNGDGKVTVNELVTAVNNALVGCNQTPAPTATGSVPPDATPTATPPVVGVERVFSIEPGSSGAPPNVTRSGLFTDALGNANAAFSIPPGPLTLVMGGRDASGIAPLSLKEDVTMAIPVLDFTCLCIKFLAQDSDGSIDCGTGTVAYDTQAVRAADATTLAWTATSGLGTPSGVPGNANLLVSALFQRVAMMCEVADCNNLVFTDPPNLFAFTTTKATAIQQPNRTLEDFGEPFDCDNFTVGGVGMLAAPAPTNQPPIGNVANIFRFADMPPP